MSFVMKTPDRGGAMALLAPSYATAPSAGLVAAAQPESVTIDFRSIFQGLSRRKWWIIAPLMLATVGGLGATMFVQPKYTSSVQILVDPREIQLVRPDASLRAQVPEAVSNVAENALVMLRSTNALMKVVDREKLADDIEFTGKTKPDDTPELLRSKALSGLERRLAVKRADRSSVIEAAVSSTNAEKSARLANALASVFLEQQIGADAETARMASNSLGSKLEELSLKVQKAEREIEEYKARNNLQSASGKLVGEQQLSELNTQLILARTRTSDARSKYESVRKVSISALDKGDLPDLANSAGISQLRLKYAETSRLEADARARFGAKHPEMVAVSAQLRDIRSLITEELTRISRQAQVEYERAKSSEDSLARSLEQLRTQSTSSGDASVRLRELERQSEASRAIYASFLKRARELGEQQDISTGNARVISPATPALYSTGVSKTLLLAGAMFAGFAIGLALALLREQFDTVMRSRDQFAQTARMPVLSVLPLRQRFAANRSSLRAHVVDEPRSAFTFGAVRMADYLAGLTQPGRPRSVLFVAVNTAVNTAEVALNVSIAAAQASWRVLMIDADSSGEGLARCLDASTSLGLVDVLERRCPLNAAVLADPRTNVRILPAYGSASPSQNGRRTAPQQVFNTVINEAQGFELVMVDGGSVTRGASIHAFAATCDDIILVAAEGATDRKEMKDAVEALRGFNHKLRGVLVA